MKHASDDFESDVARPAQIARDVAPLARSLLGKDVEVIWFGSWPQGKARPHSDIDMAISIGDPISPELMGILQEAVDDLPTLYKIDIVDLNAAGPKLREEILKPENGCDPASRGVGNGTRAIENEQGWLAMLDDRNRTSHT